MKYQFTEGRSLADLKKMYGDNTPEYYLRMLNLAERVPDPYLVEVFTRLFES